MTAEVELTDVTLFLAVTVARRTEPVSSGDRVGRRGHARDVRAGRGGGSQRLHWYAYALGEPLQSPLEAVSVWVTAGLPTIAGANVLVTVKPCLSRSACSLPIRRSSSRGVWPGIGVTPSSATTRSVCTTPGAPRS